MWTAHHWQHWLDHGNFPDHPWRTHLQRSALTLKGLSYAPTGALVAAATTSLPETPGGERNWDYRFSWIRDSTFMLWGLYTLGFDWEANDFFYFIADIAENERSSDDLQIMYAIDGNGEIPEFTLDHLSGYEGARPVRVGNGAYRQEQHDVWGALLDSMYLHTKSRNHLDDRDLADREAPGGGARSTKWREPDRGIWEIRGEPKHFTSSKMMCWVAADRGARLAEIRGELEHAARWQSAADEIQADILENGARRARRVHPALRDRRAGRLAAPDRAHALPPGGRRARGEDRARDRGRADARRAWSSATAPTRPTTGSSGEEGSFAICSFWLVSALVEIGEVRRARDLCDKLLSYASPLGLYAEEIDPRSGRHLGNFPQAFTHLALINAVMHVIRADQGLELGSLPLGRELSCGQHDRRLDLALRDRPVAPEQRGALLAREQLEAVVAVEANRPLGRGPGPDQHAPRGGLGDVLEQPAADPPPLVLGPDVGVADQVDVAHALDAHDPDELAVAVS